jgi:DNA-binding HxlR family transcriptional regulator
MVNTETQREFEMTDLSVGDIGQEEMSDRLTCAVESTIKVIGGRWKVLILRELFQGVKRFNELHRALHGITQKMLTQQLREMETDGIIHREVYAQVPPKVEYSLTHLGESLKPILQEMHQWGLTYLQSQRDK